jgi:hypothetical protein
MHKRPICSAKLRRVPSQFSWIDQRLVRERYIDQLSPHACALYLFLLTVADAQGLSYYADRSLGERLSMTHPHLRQARDALIHLGLIAYRPPLYQVLALDSEPNQRQESRVEEDDTPLDIKAVFAPIWEALS